METYLLHPFHILNVILPPPTCLSLPTSRPFFAIRPWKIDIAIELRNLGIPWTLHCWMHVLSNAQELRLDAIVDRLLQDFLQVCSDEYSSQFITEVLPLLFKIFRQAKVSTMFSILNPHAGTMPFRFANPSVLPFYRLHRPHCLACIRIHSVNPLSASYLTFPIFNRH